MARRGGPVDRARNMVEVALHALGADPARAALGEDTWLVANGSAAVVVRLVAHGEEPEAGDVHLQVLSPVMRVPREPGFAEHLLRLNHEMGGLATFSITPQAEVHLTSARTFRDLAAPDVARLIAQVAHFSDTYDDPLLAKYGAHLALRSRTSGNGAPGVALPRRPTATTPNLRFPGADPTRPTTPAATGATARVPSGTPPGKGSLPARRRPPA